MKLSTTIIAVIIAVIVVIAAVAVLFLVQGGSQGCTSTWGCAAPYPLQIAGTSGIAGEQCVSNSPSLYCIGGVDANGGPHSDVYAGSATSSGNITAWDLSPNGYPKDVSGESCVTALGNVYCVGGFDDASADDTNSSFYAQLVSGGGVGTWFYATPYPVAIDSLSCVAGSSMIYCVGGNNETDATNGTVAPSDSAWYAQLSPTGIGAWTRTTSYPSSAFLPSCTGAGGFIYCVGGADPNGNPLGDAFYASLAPSGIGQWVPTTGYPLPATGQSCNTAAGYIYCVGGATTGGQSIAYTNAVYYAPISSSGIGTWTEAQDYPDSIGTSCAISSGYIYCVGGFDGSTEGENSMVGYASLSTLRA
jgi:hypothetical protein